MNNHWFWNWLPHKDRMHRFNLFMADCVAPAGAVDWLMHFRGLEEYTAPGSRDSTCNHPGASFFSKTHHHPRTTSSGMYFCEVVIKPPCAFFPLRVSSGSIGGGVRSLRKNEHINSICKSQSCLSNYKFHEIMVISIPPRLVAGRSFQRGIHSNRMSWQQQHYTAERKKRQNEADKADKIFELCCFRVWLAEPLQRDQSHRWRPPPGGSISPVLLLHLVAIYFEECGSGLLIFELSFTACILVGKLFPRLEWRKGCDDLLRILMFFVINV